MLHRIGRSLLLNCLMALLVLSQGGCSTIQSTKKADMAIPDVPREYRSVWVATVANIDWPSKPGLSVEDQKAEMIALLDKCVELNFNSVILQVRPAGDALYDSKLEPWSYYLTGEMGKAPEPYYDPLTFAVEEAHKRGLELHAWFNPYRALLLDTKGEVSDNHLSKTHPDVVHKYGKYLWMDPSEPVVQEHSLNVILDVVKRYDIDGIHMDDYFYPYPVKENGKDVSFPDDRSWKAYKDADGKLVRDDWRRQSVNDFIEKMYKETKKLKPHVQVGLSPFGICRPGNPSYIKGFDQYESMYADTLLWLQKGWVDYFTPQLYWEIAKPDQSFTGLLGWWSEQNKKKRHIWPGVATYRTGNQIDENEIQYQIKWTRIITPKSPGTVHFSMKWYMNEDFVVNKQLKESIYAKQALPPASPWLGKKKPQPVVAEVVKIADGEVVVNADDASLVDVGWWVVQVKQGGKWTTQIVPAASSETTIKLADAEKKIDRVVVSQVSRTGIQSKHTELELP